MPPRKWYAAGDKCIMGYGGAIKNKTKTIYDLSGCFPV